MSREFGTGLHIRANLIPASSNTRTGFARAHATAASRCRRSNRDSNVPPPAVDLAADSSFAGSFVDCAVDFVVDFVVDCAVNCAASSRFSSSKNRGANRISLPPSASGRNPS